MFDCQQLQFAIQQENYALVDKILTETNLDTNQLYDVIYEHVIQTDNVFMLGYLLNHHTQNITQTTLLLLALDAETNNKDAILNSLNGYLHNKIESPYFNQQDAQII